MAANSDHFAPLTTRKPITSSPLSDISPVRHTPSVSFSSSFQPSGTNPSPQHLIPSSTAALTTSTSTDTVPMHSFHQRMAALRDENSQVMQQSQRLLSQLESSSHKYLLANSKLHPGLSISIGSEEEGRQDEGGAGGGSSGKRNGSRHHLKGQEWNARQASLQQQVADAQAECRRIRAACSEVEQRASRRAEALAVDRSPSSQSLHGLPSSRHTSFLSTLPPRVSSSSVAPQRISSVSSTLKPPPALNRSLSTSNSSLASIKSAREPLVHSGNDYSSIPAHPSSLMEAELEKGRMTVKKLQKQVSVLEQQLADKSRAAEVHVQELSHLRTLLAKEKADHAMATHKASEKAASELGRVRALHVEQSSELEARVQRLRADKISGEQECEQQRASLRASQLEIKTLKDNMSSLLSQLDQERLAHKEAMSRLQGEAEEGGQQVAHLQQQLEGCKEELAQCLQRVEGEMERFRKEESEYKQQVAMLSSQLEQCRSQLAEGTTIIHRLQGQLLDHHQVLREEQERKGRREEELSQRLEQTQAEKQSLLHQLEEAGREISSHSQRLAGLQESSLHYHQLEGELGQLKRALAEQQTQRQEEERGREVAEREKERAKGEVVELRQRLEQASQQLAEMQARSEGWRGEREQQRIRLKELQSEVETAQQEREQAVSELRATKSERRQKDSEVDASLTQMQTELMKRAQQVMELDSLLRTHQADTTSKRLQLERTLAQRQADLRSRTQEVEDLTSKLSQALQSVDQLQRQLEEENASKQHDAPATALLSEKEAELASLRQQLREAEVRNEVVEREVREREERGRETIAQLEAQCSELQKKNQLIQQQQHAHQSQTDLAAEKEAQLSSLQQQLQQQLQLERVRQEELARCRAQVASLSAELAVERQMVEETRKELAQARAGRVVSAYSLPTLSPTHPPSSQTTQVPNMLGQPYHPQPPDGRVHSQQSPQAHNAIIHI